MPRLLVHVEGETEELFVNEILSPFLQGRGFESVAARLLGNARFRANRGGIRPWPTVLNDISRHLKTDAGAIATTMVDYYALPATGTQAWPGRASNQGMLVTTRASAMESAMLDAVAMNMGATFVRNRFIPYVVMHEFEGLLFSDCTALCRGIGQPQLLPSFQAIRDQFSSPEEINDSPLTAPSKRLLNLIPTYQKPIFGSIAVLEIGIDTLRRECPIFNNWIERLENAAIGRFCSF